MISSRTPPVCTSPCYRNTYHGVFFYIQKVCCPLESPFFIFTKSKPLLPFDWQRHHPEVECFIKPIHPKTGGIMVSKRHLPYASMNVHQLLLAKRTRWRRQAGRWEEVNTTRQSGDCPFSKSQLRLPRYISRHECHVLTTELTF